MLFFLQKEHFANAIDALDSLIAKSLILAIVSKFRF